MMPRDRIICRDGFTVSVQASRFNYCTPRITDSPYYAKVELGFPSTMLPKSFDEYCDDESRRLGTVYGYVPVFMVIELINSHGGSDNSWLDDNTPMYLPPQLEIK